MGILSLIWCFTKEYRLLNYLNEIWLRCRYFIRNIISYVKKELLCCVILNIKDIIIIILIIFLIGAVLFGSLGNFLGVISSFINGVSDSVSNTEGYVL